MLPPARPEFREVRPMLHAGRPIFRTNRTMLREELIELRKNPAGPDQPSPRRINRTTGETGERRLAGHGGRNELDLLIQRAVVARAAAPSSPSRKALTSSSPPP